MTKLYFLIGLTILILINGCDIQLGINKDASNRYLGYWRIIETTSAVGGRIEQGVSIEEDAYVEIKDYRLSYYIEDFDNKEGSFQYLEYQLDLDTLDRSLWVLEKDTIWITSSDSIVFHDYNTGEELGKSLSRQKLIRIDSIELLTDPLLVELQRVFFRYMSGDVQWSKLGDGKIVSTNNFYGDSLKSIMNYPAASSGVSKEG